MRSTLSMTLLGFGVVCLGFAFTIFVITLLGFQFNTRDEWGAAGILTIVFAVVGAALFGAGYTRGRHSE